MARGVNVAQGDTHAGGDGNLVLADSERFAQYLEEALRDADRGARVPKVCEQDGELIPAETGGTIPRPKTVAYARAHLD